MEDEDTGYCVSMITAVTCVVGGVNSKAPVTIPLTTPWQD